MRAGFDQPAAMMFILAAQRAAIAASPRRVRPARTRDLPIDHQDTEGTDATLAVRKEGVGTITFDTTTGDTFVASDERLVDAALALLRRLDTIGGAEFEAGAADGDIEALRAALDPYLFG